METIPDATNPSVTIQVSQLDSLMNLAGELVLYRNQLLQAINSGSQRMLEITGQHIDLVTTEIQERIMGTRMQSIGMLYNKLSSMADKFSRQSEKPVDLSMAGRQVDIDKIIMDSIEPPLARLLESTIKYAIEPPDERIKKGKPARGTIDLAACHEAGQVIIDFMDDGRGLDEEKMARRITEKGLVADSQGSDTATDRESSSFVFLPGMVDETDTDDEFLQLVGMEEIRTCLDSVGGTIHVASRDGRGKQIRIKLPLILSIIPCQIIRLGEERFAIPQVNLKELLRVSAGQIKHKIEIIGGAEVIRLRGELLPVIDLATCIGMERWFVHPSDGKRNPERRLSLADRRSSVHGEPQKDYEGPEQREPPVDRRHHPDSALNIAVVSAGKFKYGLVVDAMNDSEEIVAKPLGRHLCSCRGFAGATIMGDGKVALILDVANIGEMASLSAQDSRGTAGTLPDVKMPVEENGARSEAYLFFSNSESERLAVPLDAVSRIEKIEAGAIETVGDNRVLKYRGGTLPLIALEDAIHIDPLPQRSHYQVICFHINGREVGLLAAPPIDAAEVAIQLDTKTLKQPGVMGSMVLMDQTTLIIDIGQVVNNALPALFQAE